MSQNDKILVDMAATNSIHINAMMKAIKDHGIELQPYIDAELVQRDKELKEIAEREAAAKKQVEEALKKAKNGAGLVQPPEFQEGEHEPPKETPEVDDEAPLIFGAEEEKDVVRQNS